jgi:DNA-binding winged helix-turn-helix (wHTH) protein/TolB-like protein
MSEQNHRLYEFGPFRLDAAKRLLYQAGEVVPLKPKVFETLLVLVEQSGKQGGRVLGKDELMERLWAGKFVEEGNLTFNVSKLREALGESPHQHRYIVTVPGEGYRFVAGVTELADESAEINSRGRIRTSITDEEPKEAHAQAGVGSLSAPVRPRNLRLPVLLACALLVGLAAVIGYYMRAKRVEPPASPAPPAPGTTIRSIAVLPFKPLVVEGRDASLELGMADSLIMRLSTLGQITVRPLSAVRRYTDLEQDAIKAGQELRVESVLEGNIQRLQDRIRVRVRLVRIGDGKPLWVEQFDEKFTDIFAVQDSISERVAGALALKLTGEEEELLAKHHTDNPEAYRAYLLGLFFWEKSTGDGARKAIGYFEEAIRLDQNYALAYAGLAKSYAILGVFGLIPLKEAQRKTLQLATRALELDDKLAEAHASMAAAVKNYYWNWPDAEKHFRRAIALKPSYAQAHEWYGWSLACVGRFDEAIAEARRAFPSGIYLRRLGRKRARLRVAGEGLP